MKFVKVISAVCAIGLVVSLSACADDGTNTSPGSGQSSISGTSGGSRIDVSDPYTPDTSSEVLKTPYEKALDVSSWVIGVEGEWIYYLNSAENSRIYKCKKDGSSPTKVTDDSVSWFMITSDKKIKYATDYKADIKSNSYTVNLDGTNKVDNKEILLDIFEKPEYKASNGKIYYCINETDDKLSGIYTREEGQKPAEGKEFLTGLIDSLTIKDDWVIYSVNQPNNVAVFRIKLDGSSKAKVFDVSASCLTVSDDGNIYFVNQSDGNKIYKMKIGDVIA